MTTDNATDNATDTAWSVAVDRKTCIGSGMCTGSTPGFFQLVDGRSQAKVDGTEPDDDVLAAAENCPVEAIRVVERETGRLLAPEL